jgi:hypothetical protein
MFIPGARDVLIEAEDQLIDPLVQHDEATGPKIGSGWIR